MKLYTRWQNSAGERVRIALNLKGIEYEYVPVASLPPGEYQRINPQQLLPTLEVDGHFIAQSAAILDYLEERFPSPALLPDDLVLRAQARAFGAAIAAEMHAIAVNRVRTFLTDEFGVDETGLARWAAHWHKLGYEALEAALARRETAWTVLLRRDTRVGRPAPDPATRTLARSGRGRVALQAAARGRGAVRQAAGIHEGAAGPAGGLSGLRSPAALRADALNSRARRGMARPCTSRRTTARTILAFSTR